MAASTRSFPGALGAPAAAGDGFAAACARYTDFVRQVAFEACGDRDLAEDVLQETLLVFADRFTELNDPDSAHGWLRAIAYNKGRDLLRRRRRRDAESLDAMLEEGQPEPSAPVPSVLVPVTEHVVSDRTLRAIRGLSPRLAEVVELRYLASMDYGDIAKALGVAIGTVKSRMHRAHAILAERLAVEFPRRLRDAG